MRSPSYGLTWWGAQWLQALTQIDHDNRLPRGRSYANRGAVRDLVVAGSKVSARVQGSRPRPYEVTIGVPQVDEARAARLMDRLPADPGLVASLLNRTLEPAVLQMAQQLKMPIFLLSLKAGGTGLNLTAASHVLHFDLWWNPAVEAQATDRAYRIGQQRNVQVPRFITRGSCEERMDAKIRSKRELAEMAVGTGETWIGQLPERELRQAFELAHRI